jgi:hypothetical protein
VADEHESLDFDEKNPMLPIIGAWISKIKKAVQHKKKQFGDNARECMRFYNGVMDELYDTEKLKKGYAFRRDSGDDADWPAPTFQMQTNKVAEAVQIFGPVLYHQNPARQVSPRKKPELPPGLYEAFQPVTMQEVVYGPDPQQQMMQQAQEQATQMSLAREATIDQGRSALLEWYLNYTPRELGQKFEMRAAIDEAIIKGMSTMWIEMVTPVGGGPRLVGSFYDSVDNLQMDPDSEKIEDCKWIARRCIHPVWEVERMYNLPKGSLKGNYESYNQQGEVDDDDGTAFARKRGDTNDLMVYWKIYSKMGVGGRLNKVDEKYRDVLDLFGDYAYLVVAEGVQFLLNLPNDQLSGDPQEVLRKLDWPTPYWLDSRWPMQPLWFHRVPRQLWPMSHFWPAMGELKALNWLYSMIISKVGLTCRDFIAMLKSASPDIKEAILHGRDLTYISIDATGNQNINEIVQFLQHPTMNADVWRVLEAVKAEFEKRTGLSELVYGMSSRQMRSAEEANVKADQINVRPEEMAQKVEDFAGELAKSEALCIRWHLTAADIEPLAGKEIAQLWSMLVISADPFQVSRQLEYGIEAGSTKKPNRERDAAAMQSAMQLLLQPFFQVAAQGMPDAFNNLVFDWAKTQDLDGSRYQINLPPPPPPPQPGQQGGNGEQKPGEQGAPDQGGGQPAPPGAAGPQMVGMPPMAGPQPMQVGFS